ncbi:MAG TPA: dipeptide/oligopeptide/nickel ABC transporter ATP-binding protein [Clostridiaceae bacterium]|nr:dipeptide/oligopeptide/nickel ABC transporter ATP-binding protein [Clostridiaceae bacterium]
MKEKLLEINNLTVQYVVENEVVEAVNNVSFTLNRGETLGLVGETGAGKTTLALSILRLIPDPPGKIVSGKIIFNGKNIMECSDKEMRKIRGEKISMIFQDPMTSLNPVLTVGDQITEMIRLHDKVSRTEAARRAVQALESVGIPGERYLEYPHQFSGGMKQRVIIAIALACNPELLIADEPTTALDVTIQAQVLNLMVNLKEKMNTSLLLITHDLGVVAETCDKVAIVYAGEIVEYGTLEHIFNNPCHPYTLGLFGSLPSLDHDVKRLKPIPGMMPNPADLPVGCNFMERCSQRMDSCKMKKPATIEVEPGHFVKCYRAGKEMTEK